MIGISIANSLGLNSRSSSSVDPDAQAFITAAGITDPTQQTAINSLVVNLKANGLWTKMNAIYPFVGGTSSTHKWNLKDPRDLDAAYRLVFSGGWTHSSTGATPNGVNAYADTFLIPSAVLNYASLSYYSRTSTAEIGTGDANGIVVGVRSDNTTANNALNLRVKSNPTNNNDFFYSRTGSATNNSVRIVDSSGLGLFSGALDATSSKIYRNGINLGGSLLSFSRNTPNLSIYIGALNNKGFGGEYSLKEGAFAHIGDTLNGTEMANLYTVVQAFQTTLGRQV
jgi:hypothetical protein